MPELPTPVRKLTVWVHAPSQPLMQSPLSRSQTPAASRKAVGFFGSGCPPSCPGKLITRPTSDWPNVDSANPFSRRQFFSLGVVRSRVNCPFLVQFPRRVGRGFVSRMDSIPNLPVPSETALVASRNVSVIEQGTVLSPSLPPRAARPAPSLRRSRAVLSLGQRGRQRSDRQADPPM